MSETETNRTARLLLSGALFTTATVAGILAMRWILQHPDAGRTINMRAALTIQKAAHQRADRWRIIADKAGTRYNQLRNISV